MRRFRPWVELIVVTGLTACHRPPTNIAPPRVEQGGRAVSIAVSPNDQKRIIVATDSGGLFRTFNGGTSWHHLDGLPNFKTIDVAFDSLDPKIVIATTQPAYRTVNDGGIWRSTNGGDSWTQPTGWAPSPGSACPDRPGAWGISQMPLSHTFYVGTDCGLAISNDAGVTWSHITLDPAQPGNNPLRHRVRSVLVVNRTSGVAAADFGLFHLGPDGAWVRSADVTTGHTPVVHAFASPWFTGTSSIYFHASEGQKLFLSSDTGATWSQLDAPSIQNRESFVRVARSLTNDDSKMDVYYSDGMRFFRQTFSVSGPTGSGSWTKMETDHEDGSDVAFDLDRRVPILFATDGGVHRTSDQGAHWKLTGGNYGGFVALQINEVTGRVDPGPPAHQELYYGTQDNDLKASSDGGSTWPGSICCEGLSIRVSPRSVDDPARVTGTACGPCYNFVTLENFQNPTSWPNAPNGTPGGPVGAPFQIVGEAYIQQVNNVGVMPPVFDFYLTLSAGSAWSKSFSLAETPKGPPLIVGSLANPTIYQPVLKSGSIPNGGARFGLVQAKNIAGQPSVGAADGAGTLSLGSFRTMYGRYLVFGADPNNPNHMIAADAGNNQMKFSEDGGASWHSMSALTQALTDNGQYLFEVAELTLPSVVAWDPYDSCHILVGTIQNGIFRSTDGGNSWSRIDGSKLCTFVTSFYFPPTGAVWVSTYGRGLWTLSLNRQANPSTKCTFPEWHRGPEPASPVVIDTATGSGRPFTKLDDQTVCPTCSIVVIRNGWVTDLKMSDSAVNEIAISGGTIFQLDHSGKEIPLAIPNVYQPGDGKLGNRFKSRDLEQESSLRVRALVLEGNRLRAVIASETDLSFAPSKTPSVFATSAKTPGKPVLEPGESVRVIGTNFVPASRGGQPIQLSVDGVAVPGNVAVRDDGSFSIDVPLAHAPGEVVITVGQQDGLRLSTERAIIGIATGDQEKSR